MLNPRRDKDEYFRPGRLKKRPEFLCVAANEQKWVSKTVIVQALPTETEFRYGVTATKKIGGAVIRNRVKRRLRAAINDIAATTPLQSYDIVMIGRPETATTEWDILVKDLKWCLKRLNIIESE